MANKLRLKTLKKYKSTLIKNQTPTEYSFHTFLKNNDIKHHRQKIIYPYICDFYIPSKGIIVELEGSIHKKKHNQMKDARREQYLLSLGLYVMRYSNNVNSTKILEEILSFPNLTIGQKKNIEIQVSRVNQRQRKKNFYEYINMEESLEFNRVKEFGFLRSKEEDNDIFVPQRIIDKFSLKQNDLVKGVIKSPRESKEESWTLIRVENVNEKGV